MTQDALSDEEPRSFSCDPHALRLGRTIRLMEGGTPIASGRIVGLLEASTIGKVTLLLGGLEPNTSATRERSRFALSEWLNGGPERWVEEMPF